MFDAAVVPQRNISRLPGGRAPTEGTHHALFGCEISFLPSSSTARQGFPIAAGVVTAGLVSALLSRWLAKEARLISLRRQPRQWSLAPSRRLTPFPLSHQL
jgi:hypothetical protein